MALNRCLRVVRQPSERSREQLLHYKPNAVQASVPIYEKEEKINPPFKDERRIKAKRMDDGGSLLFEKRLEQIVDKEFEKRGLQLLTFSAQLEFSRAVREKIDSRNEVNTNISVLDQQIAEQRKRNELEQLKTEQALITSRGLTKEILYKQFIDKWDGKTPLYGISPDFLKITQ